MTIISYKKGQETKRGRSCRSVPTNSNDQSDEYHDDLFLQKTTLREDQINLFLQQTAITQEKQRSATERSCRCFFAEYNDHPRIDQSIFFDNKQRSLKKSHADLFIQKQR
jgi:hypothetical protein